MATEQALTELRGTPDRTTRDEEHGLSGKRRSRIKPKRRSAAHVSKRAEELDPRTEIRTQKRNAEEKTAGTHSRTKKAAREPVLARAADRENQWRLRQTNPPARWLAARTKKLDLAKPGQKEKANLSTPPVACSRAEETGSGIRNQPSQNSQHTRCKS
jgi:hypothetical protein